MVVTEQSAQDLPSTASGRGEARNPRQDAQFVRGSRASLQSTQETGVLEEIERLASLLERSASADVSEIPHVAPSYCGDTAQSVISRLMALLTVLRRAAGQIGTENEASSIAAGLRVAVRAVTEEPADSVPHRIRGPSPSDVPAVCEITGQFYDESRSHDCARAPSLMVFFLSEHRVLLDGNRVSDWPNVRGKSIFNYLVTHRRRPVPREVLMNLFWPEVGSEAARNNLNVAIYGLRKALAKSKSCMPYVLFKDGCYFLNPELDVWVDGEAFLNLVGIAAEQERAGRTDEAMRIYHEAEAMYENEYLVESRYEDWLLEVRSKFENAYHSITDRLSAYHLERSEFEPAIAVCQRMLSINVCDEESHRRLMRCYNYLGHYHLSLRQFHICRDALERELHVPPSLTTIQLYDEIRKRKAA